MEICFYDVGVCEGCPVRTGDLAAMGLTFHRIGLCTGCRHQGSRDVCGGCERDEGLLKRRDLHGVGSCAGCQRDLRLLDRRDRFEKGLPTAIQKRVDAVDPERARENRNREAIRGWLSEG